MRPRRLVLLALLLAAEGQGQGQCVDLLNDSVQCTIMYVDMYQYAVHVI